MAKVEVRCDRFMPAGRAKGRGRRVRSSGVVMRVRCAPSSSSTPRLKSGMPEAAANRMDVDAARSEAIMLLTKWNLGGGDTRRAGANQTDVLRN